MKKTLWVVVISLMLTTLSAFAQDKSQIKVKSSATVTGVVIVDISKGGKSFDLQCNEGSSFCKPLKAGTYTMVELPEHFGLYDCKNVEVYRENGDVSRPDRLGEYCLIAK